MQEPEESSHEGINSVRVQNPNKRGYFIPGNLSIPLPTRPDLLALEQTQYECGNARGDWERFPPIDFTVEEGKKGIDLVSAMDMRYCHLDDRHDPMLNLKGGSISLRLEIMGHQPVGKKAKKILTTNHKKPRDSITKQNLARQVAKIIQDHLKVEEGETPFHIPLENIFLVQIHHVARSSWQPELWYKYPTSTSS